MVTPPFASDTNVKDTLRHQDEMHQGFSFLARVSALWFGLGIKKQTNKHVVKVRDRLSLGKQTQNLRDVAGNGNQARFFALSPNGTFGFCWVPLVSVPEAKGA